MTSKEYSVVEERDALYYPYIHIRDTNWLKRTLLVFPHVVRMLPLNEFVPDDTDDFVIKLCKTKTKNGAPLLRPALLETENVRLAQQKLVKNLQTDLDRDRKAFVELYGEVAARKLKTGPHDYGFQIHRGKASDSLIS